MAKMLFNDQPEVSGSGPQDDVIDVFLCHNSADKEWVEKLAEQIESESVDGTETGRPLRVFFDKWDIDIGQNIVQKINDGLSVARFVAVVLSPEFLHAPWTALEWTHIVAQDPLNTQARLIPLFRREMSLDGSATCDLPAPFRAFNWIDFRSDADFKKSYQRLIRRIRGRPPERGQKRRPLANLVSRPLPIPDQRTSAAPDLIHDLVVSNLLPVSDYPETVWSATTSARQPKDIWEKVADAPAFILREGRLYAFSDLSDPKSPFRQVVSGTGVKGEPIATWRSNPDRWSWFIDLLNRCLRNHLGKMGIRPTKGNRYFFRGPAEGDSRQQKNADDPAREVAARKVSSADGSVFWVHHGADFRFMTLGAGLFLCVEPCYVFTSDGREPLIGPRVTPLSMKWGGKERNAAIIRHVVFWARTLGRANARILVSTGAKPVTILGLPALSRTTFGIEFDHIGLKSLMAQVNDELAEVAMSLEGASHRSSAEHGIEDIDE